MQYEFQLLQSEYWEALKTAFEVAARSREGRFKTHSARWIKKFGSEAEARSEFCKCNLLEHSSEIVKVVRRYWRLCEELNNKLSAHVEPPAFLIDQTRSTALEAVICVEAMPYWPIGMDRSFEYIWSDDGQLDAPDFESLSAQYARDLIRALEDAKSYFTASPKALLSDKNQRRIGLILSKPKASPQVHPFVLGVISRYYLAYGRIARAHIGNFPLTTPSVLTIESLIGKYDDLLSEIALPYWPVSGLEVLN